MTNFTNDAAWVLSGITSFSLTLALIVLLSPIAGKIGLLDSPSSRKMHLFPVPAVGGIAIYVAVTINTMFLELQSELLWLVATSSIVVLVGCLDDIRQLSIKTRLFVQLIATLIMLYGSDIRILSVGIDSIDLYLDNFWGSLLTIVAVIGLTNAFNMADGIDGLAAGHALIGLVLICSILLSGVNSSWRYELLVILIASSLAFWLVNVSLIPLNKVFLGDAGSLYLGFMVAWILIYFGQHTSVKVDPAAVLWCVAIPVWDTTAVMIRRIGNKGSVFMSDRNHLHYLLIDANMKSPVVLASILGISFTVGVIGILVAYNFSTIASLILYGAALVILTFAMFGSVIKKDSHS